MAQAAIQAGSPLEDVHTRTTASGPQSMAVVVGVDGSDGVVVAHETRGVRADQSSNGRQTVHHQLSGAVIPGNPVRLSSVSMPCKAVFVSASPSNTSRFVLGDENTNSTDAAMRGIPLEPGYGVALDIDDVQKIWFDSPAAGQLTWTVIT